MSDRVNVTEVTNEGFYDADSKSYDKQRWQTPGGSRTNRAQQALVAELTADWRGKRVLEVGPGTARFTMPLLRKGNRMVLADLSSGMLETARGNIEKEGFGSQVEDYVKASAYALPFDDGSFDHAISLNVFNHLDNIGKAIAELGRVTRRGGTLLFNYGNLQSFYWPAARRINRNHKAIGLDVYSEWQAPAQIDALIRDAGLERIARLGNTHMPRALEKYHLGPVVALLDSISRRGPLSRFAAFHFCLCRRP
jgi:ubiquinone/menaquinone biosynthesis C-methylase UbiE